MTDAIAQSIAQIKAKAAAAAAKKSTKLPTMKDVTYKHKQMPMDRSKLPTTIISKRSEYLKSINASGLKEAAKTLGLEVSFGLDAKAWLDKNPGIKDRLDEITELAAQIAKSKLATEAATETLPSSETTGG